MKAKTKKTVAKKAVETLHYLRTTALRALKVDPFDRASLLKAIGKHHAARGRSNVIALAKPQDAVDSPAKKAA